MPRFYFDFRQAGEYARDPDGTDFADVEQAYLEAFEAAREMWGELLKQRRDPRRCSFEVRSEAGDVLFVFPFHEVLDSCQDRRHSFHIEHTMRELVETHSRALRIKEDFAAEIEMSKLVLRQSHRLLKEPVDRS